jgi:hypothetical protein
VERIVDFANFFCYAFVIGELNELSTGFSGNIISHFVSPDARIITYAAFFRDYVLSLRFYGDIAGVIRVRSERSVHLHNPTWLKAGTDWSVAFGIGHVVCSEQSLFALRYSVQSADVRNGL